MAEDRFATEVAGKVAAMVLSALRAEGLAPNGILPSAPPRNVPRLNTRLAPKLYRVDEVAVILGRTPKAIRRLIDKKQLAVVRHGRSVRVSVQAVTDFIMQTGRNKSQKGEKQ